MSLVIDDYTVADFSAAVSKLARAGAERIVIEDGEIVAKGFWQQFRMSFMSKKKRQSINYFVTNSFFGALKNTYGENVFNKAVEDGKLTRKLEKCTKLLSRDVRYLINKCQQEQAECKPGFKLVDNQPDDFDKAASFLGTEPGEKSFDK